MTITSSTDLKKAPEDFLDLFSKDIKSKITKAISDAKRTKIEYEITADITVKVKK